LDIISPNTLFVGKNIVNLPSCHSTNDIAAEMVSQKVGVEGLVVITSSQTAGKGQRGNAWLSEPGKNLTFSILLKPSFLTVSQQFYLNIAICLALTDTLTQFLGKKVKIKWPNDIYVENKKICGVLIQNFVRSYFVENTVIGIGLNVNQSNFSESKAVSLQMITGQEYELPVVLKSILENVEKRYLQLRDKKIESLKEEYLNNLFRYKEKHFFMSQYRFEGTIVDIDEQGRLVVDNNGLLQCFNLKEIEYLF
jgi:BirA family transcriptional regulator, biotin operon repressor / biotin---[acetyl-CoA-carboxylase] ligase